jgi:hypothetical protein
VEKALEPSFFHIKNESPVFSHHPRYRPFTRDEVAPARWSTRYWDGNYASSSEFPQRGVGFFKEEPILRDGIVDIEKDESDARGIVPGKLAYGSRGPHARDEVSLRY